MRDQQLKEFSEEVKKSFADALGYKRFDRHEIFEMSDTSFVLDCIQHIDKYDYENGGADLSNMLFGLFDGYLYETIEWGIVEFFSFI